MKQAYLITAYKDFDQLYELANFFSETAYVLIHVDGKSKTITDDQIKKLCEIPGCSAFRGFSVAWGSFAHLRAILALMIKALMLEDVSYLHLLTGEDFPLYSARELDQRFLNSDRIFLSYIPPEKLPKAVKVRYRYRNLMVDKNMKNKVLWVIQDLAGRAMEKQGKVRRSIGPFSEKKIYKGLVYISMPAEAARYVISFITREGAGFWRDLKTCQVPEEFFFQTVFMNHEKWSQAVENRELRYMDWSSGDGSSPSYLTEKDYEKVLAARKEGACFARKFHPEKSRILRKKLEKCIAEEG
ncbi:MAG: beta-1,6-N-acetylglucosaminyltransferase [Lachnospiraceae bacterium]|nr:beta-1,6-N-acetylglucosaminyltransferase [Lachnospiraceae bacterium]